MMMKKKILFLDRDGVILVEPPTDYQVDSYDKLSFVPGAITALSTIAATREYELVMVTNQDGLGTESFPEENFWGPQNLMIRTLESQGIHFREVLIDRTFAHENKDTRKPGLGLVKSYLLGDFNIADSLVIGDRLTDMMLAKNMGAKGILLGRSLDSSDDHLTVDSDLDNTIVCRASDWGEIQEYILTKNRISKIERKTSETQIMVELCLDGSGASKIDTGLPFFDHMLEQIAKHGKMDLTIQCNGDLHIDEHHTIEDVGLALGEAFLDALSTKRGINRYGFLLPMDDVLAQVAVDFGGRPWLEWDVDFTREKVGDMPTEMVSHFFKSFSDTAKCNLNIKAEGDNDHHKIEGIFKAFARAIRMAVAREEGSTDLPSTKGIL